MYFSPFDTSRQKNVIPIAPTDLLPLGDPPTGISVRLSRDLLKSIDPSMEPLAKGTALYA